MKTIHRTRRRLTPAVLSVLAVAILAATTSGAIDRTKKPEMGPPPSLKLPKVQTQKLSNGLEILLVEMHEVPIVDVTVALHAGAVRDPDDLPGLATFTANMLDEGAGTRSAMALADEVSYLGATLSTTAGPENALVQLHVPRRSFEPALDLMADVLLRPAFADSEVTRQRELRTAGLVQLRDQPTAIAPIVFNAIVFGSAHPYGRPAGGNEASTPKLTRDRVRAFHDTFYRPGNARVLIVGDITAADARKMLEARFRAWKAGTVPALVQATPPPAAARAFYLVDKPGAAQSVIRIGHPGVPRSNPDYSAIQVLNTILGGAFTSRLNYNLRETHGYTYGAGSQFEMRRLAGPFRASASVVTAKTDSSLIEFFKELRRIRTEKVPAEELEKAKSNLALGLPGEFETTAGSAGEFLDLVVNDLPLDSYDSYVQKIMAVTADDVQRLAKSLIDPDHFAVVVVGDRKQIESGIAALHEGTISYRDLWGAEAK